MLEFEENRALRPKGGRRKIVFAFVAIAAALAGIAFLVWMRRNGGGLSAAADVPRETRLLDESDVDALRGILDALPVSSVVADLETSALVAGKLGDNITIEFPPRTVFGVEFRLLRQTAWIVSAAGAERLASLAHDAGLALLVRPLSEKVAIALPPPNLVFGESFIRTGIFIDYSGDGESSVRFFPSDEWVEAETGALDHPAVAQLERLALAAPYSVPLLRYFASIGNQKAASAVAARIRALSPPMSGQNAVFGGRIAWRGARLVQSPEGEAAGIRLYFSVASKAAAVFRNCIISCRFAGVGGDVLAEDAVHLSTDEMQITSFKSDSDSIDFSVLLPMPDAVAASDKRWTLNLGVHEMTARGAKRLRPEGKGVRVASGCVVVDSFE